MRWYQQCLICLCCHHPSLRRAQWSPAPAHVTSHVSRGGYSHQKYTFYPGRTSNNIHPWQRLWLQQLQDTPRHSGSGHILSTVNLLIDMFSYVLLSNIFTQWIYISIARTRIMRPSLWHDSNLDTHCSLDINSLFVPLDKGCCQCELCGWRQLCLDQQLWLFSILHE